MQPKYCVLLTEGQLAAVMRLLEAEYPEYGSESDKGRWKALQAKFTLAADRAVANKV